MGKEHTQCRRNGREGTSTVLGIARVKGGLPRPSTLKLPFEPNLSRYAGRCLKGFVIHLGIPHFAEVAVKPTSEMGMKD